MSRDEREKLIKDVSDPIRSWSSRLPSSGRIGRARKCWWNCRRKMKKQRRMSNGSKRSSPPWRVFVTTIFFVWTPKPIWRNCSHVSEKIFTRPSSNIVTPFFSLVNNSLEHTCDRSLFALVSSLLRGLMITVVHGRRNKPGKISPFLGQKVFTSIDLLGHRLVRLGCEEDLRLHFHGDQWIVSRSLFVSLVFVSLLRCSRREFRDSESEISELAYQSLIDLATIWPNSWLNKSLFDVLIYSIVAQEEKNEFHQSIVLFRRFLSHVDLEKESLRCWIHHLFVRLSSDRFELVSLSHTISIFKLINEILTSVTNTFPE